MIKLQKRNPLFRIQTILLALFGLGSMAVYTYGMLQGSFALDLASIILSIISIGTSLLYAVPAFLTFKYWKKQSDTSSLRNLHILVGIIALAGLFSIIIEALLEIGFRGNYIFAVFNGLYLASIALFFIKSTIDTAFYFSIIGWIRILFFAYAVATFQL